MPRTVARKSRTPTRKSAKAPHLPMPPVLLDATESADVVTVPARTVVSVAGQGSPESEAFQQSIGAAYGVAYTIKFTRKKAGGRDFKIGALEGRWLIADAPRDQWRWEVRLALPDDVTAAEVAAAINAATTRKGGRLEGSTVAQQAKLLRLKAEKFGRVLHVGPYADEPRSFAKIDAVMKTAGLVPGAAHLEVYLNDPRRTKPEKIKTVLLRETA